MQTSLSRSRDSHCCGQCGQACEPESTPAMHQLGVLQRLQQQNQDLLHNLKYLSKRNDKLNQEIQTRLRSEEKSISGEKRSRSGLIYRTGSHSNSQERGHSPLPAPRQVLIQQSPPTTVRLLSQSPPPRVTITYHPPIKQIPIQHLQPRLKQLPEQTPKKKPIFELPEDKPPQITTNKKQTSTSKSRRYESKYLNRDRMLSRSRERIPVQRAQSRLCYIPIGENKKSNSHYRHYIDNEAKQKETIKDYSHYGQNPAYEVTFRNQQFTQKRPHRLYEINKNISYEAAKAQKRTNQPYLAMLTQAQWHPNVYYPTSDSKALGKQGYREKRTHSSYISSLLEPQCLRMKTQY